MEHPFLDKSFSIDWSALTPGQVEPDIEAALAGAQQEIDALCEVDKSALSFENTLLALEAATEELSRAWAKVNLLDSCCNSPELRKAFNAMLPKVSSFQAKIPLNEKLWDVLQAYAKTDEAKALTGTRKRFLEETLEDFREAGAALTPEKKKRFEAIENELAQLTQKFSENCLDATNAFELYVEDEAKLAGLPQTAIAQARQSAASKDRPDAWRFTLHAPSLIPVMRYLDDEDIRRELWEAFSRQCRKEPFDNRQLLQDIVKLRAEKAALLEKAHFGDYATGRRMAKSGQGALDFTNDLHARVVDAFRRENAELEQFKAEQTGQPVGRLLPWEAAYWSEKLRLAKYDFDEEALRPYFPIDSVISGMFSIVEKLFGISIAEVPGSVWHEDVKYYSVTDEDGAHIGSFYADWHPRESKRGGAWMGYLITGDRAGGRREPHLGQINGNLTPSVGGKPALLDHREVETIFHEFGHLLHHLLGNVEVKSLNGVNVAYDFVELPSQLMENWCWERESLDLFARHYETGEPIPEELFRKMKRARNFMSATAMMRQLSFGKMDLELHIHPEKFLGEDMDAKIDTLLEDYTAPRAVPVPNNLPGFSHLFSDPIGYAAGYYSYKWSEVLDADAFTRFREEGLLNPETGRDYRAKILAKGNSEEPDTLFRDFMGRDPDLNALLIRSGLSTEGKPPPSPTPQR